MNFFIFINLLILFSTKGIRHYSGCGASKLKIKYQSLNIKKTNSKSRKYTPIKIGFDFTPFEKPDSMDSTTLSKVISIIKETRDDFAKFLKVRHQKIDLSEDKEKIMENCGINKIGTNYKDFLKNNDVIIFSTFQALGDTTLAAAGTCLTDDEEMPRPIAGRLLINPNINFEIKNTEIFLKYLLLHEITHVLVFNPRLLKILGMLKEENSINYIISPKVLQEASKHFNCSLDKLPLENQGGEGTAGAHWESRYMLTDYMIADTDYREVVMSNITLALFEDTGFYKVNYYTGDLFKFGKNKGCDFFDKKCIENGKPISEEFCVEEYQPKCSPSRTIKYRCYINYYGANLDFGTLPLDGDDTENESEKEKEKEGENGDEKENGGENEGETDEQIPEEYQYFPEDPTKGGYKYADYCPVAFLMAADSLSGDYLSRSCRDGNSSSEEDLNEKTGNNSFCFVSSLLPVSSSKDIIVNPICY